MSWDSTEVLLALERSCQGKAFFYCTGHALPLFWEAKTKDTMWTEIHRDIITPRPGMAQNAPRALDRKRGGVVLSMFKQWIDSSWLSFLHVHNMSKVIGHTNDPSIFNSFHYHMPSNSEYEPQDQAAATPRNCGQMLGGRLFKRGPLVGRSGDWGNLDVSWHFLSAIPCIVMFWHVLAIDGMTTCA